MDSIDNFRKSLSEFDILIDYAKRNTSNISKYQLFIKLSIVLLSIKFEVFIEEFMEEHAQRLLKNHTNISLPQDIKTNYLNRAVELISKEQKQQNRTELFKSIYVLLEDNGKKVNTIKNIQPSTSFNYGKHGKTEIETLFEKHGLGMFIKSKQVQNSLTLMNSLIAIRNNVIHQDASPSITHKTIIDHKDNVLNFIKLLEDDIKVNKKKYYNETV